MSKYVNPDELPQFLFDLLVSLDRNDTYSNGGADRSVTALVGPPKIAVLRKRHRDDIQVNPLDRLWAFFGTMGHSLIERALGDDCVSEQRLSATVRDWKISGQFDIMHGHTLLDIKFCAARAVQNGVKPEWEAQTNVYRWLCKHNGIRIDDIQIIALLKDWNKWDALSYVAYPPHALTIMPVTVWPMSETKAYVCKRVELHKQAEDILPACSREETWRKDECWKVRKVGSARCLPHGTHDTFEGAERFRDNYLVNHPKDKLEIAHNPGYNTRCERWCDVADFCNQAKGEIT